MDGFYRDDIIIGFTSTGTYAQDLSPLSLIPDNALVFSKQPCVMLVNDLLKFGGILQIFSDSFTLPISILPIIYVYMNIITVYNYIYNNTISGTATEKGGNDNIITV